MATTYETLQYVDATGATQEIALALVNVAQTPATTVSMEPATHAPGTFRITWAQPPEIGLAIPFKSRCIVWANRVSATGAGNSFSGGSVLFIGRRTDNSTGEASATRVASSIELSDFLWDLAHITYQQSANQITEGTLTSPIYATFYWPDVVLFQAMPGVTYSPAPVAGTLNTWQQIEDALNYALNYAAGVNAVQFQFSVTAEFAPVYRNWYPMRSAKCLEVILKCLATHLGVFTEVDHTTTLAGVPCPTIHFRNRAAMTALTLPYKSTDANGVVHIASTPQSLPHLIPDNVRLYYRWQGTFNGQPVAQPGYDFYPSGANSLLNQDFSIDLTGASRTETIKNFTSTAFDPTQLTLWRMKVPALHEISEGGQIPNDGNPGALAFTSTAAYNAGSNPKGIQVLGDDGTDYSADYATQFGYWTDDEIMAWFQLAAGVINVVKCTVKAYFSYNKQTVIGANTITDLVQEHQHTFRVVLCSIPTDQYILKQVTASGETIPTGLAEAIWTEQQALQWKFGHQIVQVAANNASLPTIVKPGKHMLNLTGGAAAWVAMNAVPQRVQIEFMRVNLGTGVAPNWVLAAKTNIQCGPVNHLNPQERIQLENVFRNRDRAQIDMNARLSGGTAGSQVDLSLTASAKENSVPAPSLPTETNHVHVTAGAVDGQTIQSAAMVAAILAATTPTPVSPFTATDVLTMKPREIPSCDSSGNTIYYIIQASAPYTKP